MNNILKRFSLCGFLIIILSYIIIITSIAINVIGDPMLLKALNNSIKQYFPNRNEMQEILEADVPYVLSLDARNLGVTDISGLEQFTYIKSTIDLNNNNITDIMPLINWVKNKDDTNLDANIFLGSNPILSNDNYKQIYTLANMGEHIHIYDSQRNGEGVIELVGFVNGRPADITKFDEITSNSNYKNMNIPGTSRVASDNKDIIDTGFDMTSIYILIIIITIFLIWKYFYYKKKRV